MLPFQYSNTSCRYNFAPQKYSTLFSCVIGIPKNNICRLHLISLMALFGMKLWIWLILSLGNINIIILEFAHVQTKERDILSI